MRTIQDIKKEMTDAFVADSTLQTAYGLTPGTSFEDVFSKVSIESIFFYIVAVSIWALEQVLNIAMGQQMDYIAQVKIHSTTWYSMMAKKFQYGDALPWGEVEYDNTGQTDDEVAAKQIVQFAAVSKIPGGLVVKVAKENSGDMAQLGDGTNGTQDELTPFVNYLFRVSAAGDNLQVRNEPADLMNLQLQIFYDPLVLDSQGQLLGTTEKPVETALTDYIKGIDFDGMLVPQSLVDALQLVSGVKIVNLMLIQTKYGNLGYVNVPPEGVTPFSGYVRLDDSVSQLTYTAG